MQKLQKLLAACSVGAALCLALTPMSASAIAVSMELSLVVDESGSVDASEWLLQRNGYISAFQSPAVHAAIVAAGGIAVEYIQFDAGRQVGIGWRHITDAASANAFANDILLLTRFGNSGTGVGDAIAFARGTFGTEVVGGGAANGFESARQVIDVSGDGANNQPIGAPANYTDLITDAAETAGVDKINGIVIDPAGEVGLLAFYQTQVQQGAGSFTIVANTFADFSRAVETKILAEVQNTSLPEGGSSFAYALLALGTLGLLARRYRNRAA